MLHTLDVVKLAEEADRNADNVTEIYRLLLWYYCCTCLPRPAPLKAAQSLWDTTR